MNKLVVSCLFFLLGALATAGCASFTYHYPAQIKRSQPAGTPAKTVVVAAAGDIACPAYDPEFRGGKGIKDACQQAATARLLAQAPLDAVLPLGDTQYDYATTAEFKSSYALSWGKFLNITHPAVGNHDYGRDKPPNGYAAYFGSRAGPPNKWYYSFNLGAWHIIALNSNCKFVSCKKGSAQERWLRRDLQQHTKLCTLAFWHHPRFSSSIHGPDKSLEDLWQALYYYRVDVVLNGHDHVYERFNPQTPDGHKSRTGVREFIVGSGGKEHYQIKTLQPNSAAHNDHTFGILKLQLMQRNYNWQFMPIKGQQEELTVTESMRAKYRQRKSQRLKICF